jgi:putative two-component system hydrogenase maturation factor HypX/HoxX
MGGLYGSEYWTYLLPRRVGPELTARLTGPPFTSLGTRQAVEIGLLDAAFGATLDSFRSQVRGMAERLARTPDLGQRLEDKRRRRARDEQIKPLNAYRKEELARSYGCFFGEDRSYHQARSRFVYKLGAPCAVTPAAAAPAGAARRAA